MRVEPRKDEESGLFRLYEVGTDRIALSRHGKPVDGGGHLVRDTTARQAGYINGALERKEQEEAKKK